MYSEDELLPLSALQHLLFCERQCALIHIECLWDENRLTVEGKQMHEQVHQQKSESRKDVIEAFSLLIHSFRLGLSGKADVVEFHRVEKDGDGVKLPNKRGLWLPFPVEYKHGRPKRNRCDEVQLCAQAICLEEMLNVKIESGALFYGKTRKRKDIDFDQELRNLTEISAERLHRLFEDGKTPPAKYERKCRSCSLLEVCMPEVVGGKSAKRYLSRIFREEI